MYVPQTQVWREFSMITRFLSGNHFINEMLDVCPLACLLLYSVKIWAKWHQHYGMSAFDWSISSLDLRSNKIRKMCSEWIMFPLTSLFSTWLLFSMPLPVCKQRGTRFFICQHLPAVSHSFTSVLKVFMTLSFAGYSRNYQQPDDLWQEAVMTVMTPSNSGNPQDCIGGEGVFPICLWECDILEMGAMQVCL